MDFRRLQGSDRKYEVGVVVNESSAIMGVVLQCDVDGLLTDAIRVSS